MDNKELVATLRELAEFYECHPNVPAPWEFNGLTVFLDKEQKDILKLIGSFEKSINEDCEYYQFTATKKIGHVEVKFRIDRAAVCERKVVGTRVVPARVIPEQVIEEKVEEIVEWDCKPVLGGE